MFRSLSRGSAHWVLLAVGALAGVSIVAAGAAPSPGNPSGVTVAGGNGLGSAANQLNHPVGLSVDSAGNVYVVDLGNDRVQKWAPGATVGVTVAGGNGDGAAANQLSSPAALFVDGTGNVYVSDPYNNRVQLWTPGATAGVTVAGGNGQGAAANQLNHPYGMSVDAAGNVYVADTFNDRVQEWAPGATAGITVAGGNGAGSAANQLGDPEGVSVDAAGDVFVADTGLQRVQMWAPGATSGVTVAGGNGYGSGADQFNGPTGLFLVPRPPHCIRVACVPTPPLIYVADANNHRVQLWVSGATSGVTVAGGIPGGSGASQFDSPLDVFVGGAGYLYVSDSGNDRVQRWNALSGIVSPPPLVRGDCSGVALLGKIQPALSSAPTQVSSALVTARPGTVINDSSGTPRTSPGVASCTFQGTTYDDVKVGLHLTGVASCDATNIDPQLVPLNGKLSFLYGGATLKLGAYVSITGYDFTAGRDIVTLAGIVTSGQLAGLKVSGELFFDPVLPPPRGSHDVSYDSSQIGRPCELGGDPIALAYVGDGISLRGNTATGLTFST
jgi:archaellum component FlaF (FlaF/FlaG flagellin family)